MGLKDTPSGERIHIGFFGKRNAGKSSLVNAVTGQNIAIVSEEKGTTTDPVYKSMELLPLGPVMVIDTPGFDDEGKLGSLRIEKTVQVLSKTDIAVLVTEADNPLDQYEQQLLSLFKEKELKHIIVFNKYDIGVVKDRKEDGIYVSALTGYGINHLKEKLGTLGKREEEKRIVADLLNPNDIVVLVTPIDSSAPKGRLILPQQQTIRDILDNGSIAVVTKETEFEHTLSALGKKPALVITDSQVFSKVSAQTPQDVPLTSFSILMARYKGFLDTAVMGATVLNKLKDGDTVLISEGCTHHRQCEDIGTVKLPRWLADYTGKQLNIKTTSGTEFPQDLSLYSLVIHCGGCMLNQREVQHRMQCAINQNIPFTNYGTAIAHINGILKRSLEIIKVT